MGRLFVPAVGLIKEFLFAYRKEYTVYCLLSTVYCLLSTVYCLIGNPLFQKAPLIAGSAPGNPRGQRDLLRLRAPRGLAWL